MWTRSARSPISPGNPVAPHARGRGGGSNVHATAVLDLNQRGTGPRVPSPGDQPPLNHSGNRRRNSVPQHARGE